MEEIIKSSNFIHDFIDEDLEKGVYNKVQTRFPPEPNGYLHIGHAKAICINFGTAEKYKGVCNLRLDDTNPQKEDTEYVDAIKEDIEWLGFKWNECLFASSYFDFIYDCAIKLINKGLAYVDDLTADEIKEYRGTLTEPGKNSPYRDRPVEENLEQAVHRIRPQCVPPVRAFGRLRGPASPHQGTPREQCGYQKRRRRAHRLRLHPRHGSSRQSAMQSGRRGAVRRPDFLRCGQSRPKLWRRADARADGFGCAVSRP